MINFRNSLFAQTVTVVYLSFSMSVLGLLQIIFTARAWKSRNKRSKIDNLFATLFIAASTIFLIFSWASQKHSDRIIFDGDLVKGHFFLAGLVAVAVPFLQLILTNTLLKTDGVVSK
jgi:formate/nitrite transporter FocA (FNT family)